MNRVSARMANHLALLNKISSGSSCDVMIKNFQDFENSSLTSTLDEEGDLEFEYILRSLEQNRRDEEEQRQFRRLLSCYEKDAYERFAGKQKGIFRFHRAWSQFLYARAAKKNKEMLFRPEEDHKSHLERIDDNEIIFYQEISASIRDKGDIIAEYGFYGCLIMLLIGAWNHGLVSTMLGVTIRDGILIRL